MQDFGRRKRRITACSECYRRKQKCDRKRPCNCCIRRHIVDRCAYGDDALRLVAGESERKDYGSGADAASRPPGVNSDYADTVGYPTDEDRDPIRKLQEYIPIARQRPSFAFQAIDNGSDAQFNHRYRLIVASLPSHTVITELANIYFAEVNASSQVLERVYFDKMYLIWLKATTSTSATTVANLARDVIYFSALLFQVLAVALQFLPSGTAIQEMLQIVDQDECDRTSQRYSRLGEELLVLLGRQHSTIFGIQHDLLRAQWLKTSGRGVASWHALGTAIRQAQDQELHLRSKVDQLGENVKETLANIWHDEYKRRLWATLFSWDSHMAVTLNRPRMINISDCSVERPTDCDFPTDITTTIPRTSMTDDPPCSTAALLFNYDISYVVHDMFSCGAHMRHVAEYDDVLRIDKDTRALIRKLPPALRPTNPDTSWDSKIPRVVAQRHSISVVANSFLLCLHRDHISLREQSYNAAIAHALAVLESQSQLISLMPWHQTRQYSLSCQTINAGIFLSFVMSTSPPKDQELSASIWTALCKSCDQLTRLAEKNPLARCGMRILLKFIQCQQSMVRDSADRVLDITSALQKDTEARLQAPVLAPTELPRDAIALAAPSQNVVSFGDHLDLDMFEDLAFGDPFPDLFSVNFTSSVDDLDKDFPSYLGQF